MDKIFEIIDKFGNKIRLTNKQYKHIQKHPHLHDSIEVLKLAIENPTTIRYNEEDESVKYFYKEFKEMSPEERYLLVSIKFLNNEGFIITAFYMSRFIFLRKLLILVCEKAKINLEHAQEPDTHTINCMVLDTNKITGSKWKI